MKCLDVSKPLQNAWIALLRLCAIDVTKHKKMRKTVGNKVALNFLCDNVLGCMIRIVCMIYIAGMVMESRKQG